jgi:hypothetical protein
MSFSDALNKIKAVAETEQAREGDGPRAQTTTASQSRKQRRVGWKRWSYVCPSHIFRLGDHGDVAAGEI